MSNEGNGFLVVYSVEHRYGAHTGDLEVSHNPLESPSALNATRLAVWRKYASDPLVGDVTILNVMPLGYPVRSS